MINKNILKRLRFIFSYLLPLFLLHTIISPFPSLAADDSICAQVKIEIRQEMTLERQAFDAHMRINNGLTHIALENVEVEVTFSDQEGNEVPASSDPDGTEALFFIRVDSMENIDNLDSGGTVLPSSSADIHWLIIPAPGAAGSLSEGTLYYVGATLSYTMGGEQHVTRVAPDYIFVKPMPQLIPDYFLPCEVYGDDAFTQEIEPSIPFTLGVRVKNNGFGVAKNLKIDSAQPKIVENEQGLLIGFVIEGCQVNGREATKSLLAEFGDIELNTSGAARWIMTCSLSGKFVEFTARYSHSNELGGELTSLLEAVNTHFLIRDVLVDLPGRDTIPDFLARDGGVYRVYESESVDTSVLDQSSFSAIQPTVQGIGQTDPEVYYYLLSTPVTDGFMYVQLPDPYNGQKRLKEMMRSDGKRISAENAWFSKTRNEDHTWQHFINLFDVNTTGSYTLIFEDAGSESHPPILQFIPDRASVEGNQLSFIVEASDPDGTIPLLTAAPLPALAAFTDQGKGTGIFDWSSVIGQAGSYEIIFTASDGVLKTSRSAVITINSGGNCEVEICDGVDNDCDGRIDEDFYFQTDPDNCGACGHTCRYAHATGVCSNGTCTLGACDNGYYNLNNDPSDGCEYACTISTDGVEICDGIDNDCDGESDEDCFQMIPLQEGWNLISFQINKCFYEGNIPSVFIPEGVTSEEVDSLQDWLTNDSTSPIRNAAVPEETGKWQRIVSFDEAGAHIIDMGLASHFNTLHYLSVGYGYWVRMNEPGVLIIHGAYAPHETTISLQEGWNLIGFIPADFCYGDLAQEEIYPYRQGIYSPEDHVTYCYENHVGTVFTGIEGKFQRVISFDPFNGAMIYDINLPSFINTLHYLGPKYGYWIRMTEKSNLSFPIGCGQ